MLLFWRKSRHPPHVGNMEGPGIGKGEMASFVHIASICSFYGGLWPIYRVGLDPKPAQRLDQPQLGRRRKTSAGTLYQERAYIGLQNC